MICSHCQAENREDAKFCDECGACLQVSEEESEAAAQEETAESSENLDASVTKPIDLSGFDGYLAADAYTSPAPSWRDGNTMEMPPVEKKASSANTQRSFVAPQEKKKRHLGLKIALTIILGLAIVAGLAAFATYQMELWGGRIVPDVVGLTQADATNTLESKGFSVRATQVKSDETEGLVLLMDPTQGSRLEEGEEVVIHVAVSRTVPSVVGLTQEEAESLFEEEGLDNVSYVTERSDETAGTVLAVEPGEGERVRSSTEIVVTVAEPYTVPTVEGMTADEAQAAVAEAGYESYIEYVYTEDVSEGTVLGTSPAAGEVLSSGSQVAVQVARSRASELVAATQSFLASGNNVVIDGVNYTVVSCDAVDYLGDETTAYTITAEPYTYLLGVRLPLEAQAVSGTITWNADNSIAGGSPSISSG